MSRTHFSAALAHGALLSLSSSPPRPSLCPVFSVPPCQRSARARCESNGARPNRCRCSFPCPGACFLAFMRSSSFMDPAVFVTRADSHPRRLKTTVGGRARALLTGSRVANTCAGWPVQHISSISVRVPCAQLVADHDAETLNASALCVALLTRAQPHAHRVVRLTTSYIARTRWPLSGTPVHRTSTTTHPAARGELIPTHPDSRTNVQVGARLGRALATRCQRTSVYQRCKSSPATQDAHELEPGAQPVSRCTERRWGAPESRRAGQRGVSTQPRVE